MHEHCLDIALLLKKVVFPVNVRLLLRAMIPPPSTMVPHALLHVNSVFPDRVMLHGVIHRKCSVKVVMEGTVN